MSVCSALAACLIEFSSKLNTPVTVDFLTLLEETFVFKNLLIGQPPLLVTNLHECWLAAALTLLLACRFFLLLQLLLFSPCLFIQLQSLL